ADRGGRGAARGRRRVRLPARARRRRPGADGRAARRAGLAHLRRGRGPPRDRRRGRGPGRAGRACAPRRRTVSAVAPARGGRHRNRACDETILAATLEILGEVGYEALTIAAVIERAGVSSATLYRRFTAKHDLVAAAIGSLLAEPAHVDTGSLAGDVLAFPRNVSRSFPPRLEPTAER